MTWNNFCTGYGCIGCSFLHRMDSLAQHSLSDKSLAVTTSIEWRTVMAQYRTVIWLESWLFTSGYWIKLNPGQAKFSKSCSSFGDNLKKLIRAK
ncbi:uncharacterized protein isoform X3 [Rhodnius prolixus]|uniref:uncharacterized protein isoform X3 n=1 Tax=Rhodnius prolixus TaxID=13249 RepID=UPI003D187CF3